ncbi:MAG TPA: hypothetical protein VGG12_08215 [Methylovirgula sp.]
MDPLPNESGSGTATNGAAEPRPSPLRLAIRKARVEEAERTAVIAELHGAETARLEMLEEELRPVVADVPQDVDMVDMGLVPGERPRLFIDMVAFVEMARDRRTYHFVQSTRYGRVVLAESERLEPIVTAVVDYLARRLIEREKTLAGDTTLDQAARAYLQTREAEIKKAAESQPRSAPHKPGFFSRSFSFLIELLGSTLLFALLAMGIWNAMRFISAWILAHH